jgi:hypothetical protein
MPACLLRLCAAAVLALAMTPAAVTTAPAQFWTWKKVPDQRGEFVRLCAPHMVARSAHPEAVCGCLHDQAIASVADNDLREALLHGVSERGVPTIERDWIPASKRALIDATFTQIARPALQCMFDPAE